MRTGINASKSCNCSEDIDILNCGVDVHGGLPLKADNNSINARNIVTDATPWTQLDQIANNTVIISTGGHSERPFSCISQKHDRTPTFASLPFELLVIFSSGLTAVSESAPFIIGSINKSSEALFTSNYDDDIISSKKDKSNTNVKLSKKTSGKTITKKTDKTSHNRDNPSVLSLIHI